MALTTKLRALSAASTFRERNLPQLILLTDAPRQGPLGAVIDALPSDAVCWVVFRDYAMPPADRLEAAGRARALCAARGIPFLLARDVGLALRVEADGVHCPQALVPELPGLRRAHPQLALWSAACHDAESLGRAAALGASVALLSPVFPTRSHPGAGAMGTGRLAALVRSQPALPIYAMGGVGSATIDRLVEARTGVAGVAGIDIVADFAGCATAPGAVGGGAQPSSQSFSL